MMSNLPDGVACSHLAGVGGAFLEMAAGQKDAGKREVIYVVRRRQVVRIVFIWEFFMIREKRYSD